MGLFDFMYVIPKEEYMKIKNDNQHATPSDSIGDLHKSQVNNIEVSQGGTIVIDSSAHNPQTGGDKTVNTESKVKSKKSKRSIKDEKQKIQDKFGSEVTTPLQFIGESPVNNKPSPLPIGEKRPFKKARANLLNSPGGSYAPTPRKRGKHDPNARGFSTPSILRTPMTNQRQRLRELISERVNHLQGKRKISFSDPSEAKKRTKSYPVPEKQAKRKIIRPKKVTTNTSTQKASNTTSQKVTKKVTQRAAPTRFVIERDEPMPEQIQRKRKRSIVAFEPSKILKTKIQGGQVFPIAGVKRPHMRDIIRDRVSRKKKRNEDKLDPAKRKVRAKIRGGYVAPIAGHKRKGEEDIIRPRGPRAKINRKYKRPPTIDLSDEDEDEVFDTSTSSVEKYINTLSDDDEAMNENKEYAQW